jgi:tetraacyldisaccharide 4'-kinase
VVLDDGFQHRRLARDLDLVLIDATRSELDDRLLPYGWQREPASSLRRADAVIVTRSNGVDERLAAVIERWHGRPPLAWTRHAWTTLQVHTGGVTAAEAVAWLAGRRVVTMLGVGNPAAVRSQAESAGAVIVADLPVRDHEAYDRSKMMQAKGLCDGMDALLMTPKDWVKARDLIDLESWPTPIVVPQLEIEVLQGVDALDDRILQAVTCHR